jgi:prepilin-type N-terminal cleavage/methylation domain-containing protein
VGVQLVRTRKEALDPSRSESSTRLGGFTLLEMLVVATILGILAAVTMLAVSGIRDRGHASACEIEVRVVNTAIESYYTQSPTRSYPPGPTVAELFSQLHAAKVLAEDGAGATATYSPAYDTDSHDFSASCPA